MKIKGPGKAILALMAAGGVIYGIHVGSNKGYFSMKPGVQSSVPDAKMPVNPDVLTSKEITKINTEKVSTKYKFTVLTIPWNGTLGLQYANGNTLTAPGSLMDQRGLNVLIKRQDMYDQMQIEQVKFAKEFSEGNDLPTGGAAFVIIMGDGYPAYVAGVQDALSRFGHQIKVIGAIGYSRGEDKCILDKNASPRGSLIAAVPRDGDWNICVKYAADNNIPINSNDKVYDPDAMNFVPVNEFKDADEKFITGACNTFPVIRQGKLTGENVKKCVNGTATWTPGDIKVARERGNIKVLASTKEYLWQMPTIIIGNDAWMKKHPQLVENFLASALEGSEMVRADDMSLTLAANVAAKVFEEQDGKYWKTYYKGTIENGISLGGSTTIGLADNAHLFGLNGNYNLYKQVYTVFGNLAVKYYPDVMPKLIPYEKVVDTTYLERLLAKSKNLAPIDKPLYTEVNTGSMKTFASKPYQIEFEFNKATFTPAALRVLNEMVSQISISGLRVQIEGHTDSVGDAALNMDLSRRRAEAVKAWVSVNASSTFPSNRIRTVGFGDTNPIADNKTSEGRAKNRRVVIQLLTSNNS